MFTMQEFYKRLFVPQKPVLKTCHNTRNESHGLDHGMGPRIGYPKPNQRRCLLESRAYEKLAQEVINLADFCHRTGLENLIADVIRHILKMFKAIGLEQPEVMLKTPAADD